MGKRIALAALVCALTSIGALAQDIVEEQIPADSLLLVEEQFSADTLIVPEGFKYVDTLMFRPAGTQIAWQEEMSSTSCR